MSKILLVEDDAILRSMYQDKFTHDGFTVEVAQDGEEGINKMRSFRPDIVLLDLLMPEQSGFDVLKFAKQDPELQNIPIVILTNAHADEAGMIKDWGIAAFMMKADHTPEDVARKVNNLLSPSQKT